MQMFIRKSVASERALGILTASFVSALVCQVVLVVGPSSKR